MAYFVAPWTCTVWRSSVALRQVCHAERLASACCFFVLVSVHYSLVSYRLCHYLALGVLGGEAAVQLLTMPLAELSVKERNGSDVDWRNAEAALYCVRAVHRFAPLLGLTQQHHSVPRVKEGNNQYRTQQPSVAGLLVRILLVVAVPQESCTREPASVCCWHPAWRCLFHPDGCGNDTLGSKSCLAV